MLGSLRLEYAGAVYHVMCRGDRREAIFLADGDREFFLATLAEMCGRTGIWIHSHVLMGNHYHLLLKTPDPNLVAGMKWLQAPTRSASTRATGSVVIFFKDATRRSPSKPGQRTTSAWRAITFISIPRAPGISVATAHRDWTYARAWPHQDITGAT